MHAAESSGGSISRRTRSCWDSFYRSQYCKIRNKSCVKSGGVGNGEWSVRDKGGNPQLEPQSESFAGKTDGSVFDVEDSSDSEDMDDSDFVSDDDESNEDQNDYDEDYKLNASKYVQKKGGRIISLDDSDEDYRLNASKCVQKKGGRIISLDDSDEDCKLNAFEYGQKEGVRKGRGPSKKNKANLIVPSELINILVDSIWKEKDLIREKPISMVGNFQSGSTTLPLKFGFEEDDKSCFADKTALEKEIESLFDDLEMGLWESHDECTNSHVIDDECAASMDNDQSPAARCARGEHDPFLDEQIGLICQYCCMVLLDIKYVFPHFVYFCAFVAMPSLSTSMHLEPLDSFGKNYRELSPDSVTEQIKLQGLTQGHLESAIHSKGTVFDFIADAKKELYPHQLEGFEFLWRNIAGDIHIDKLEKLSAGGGRGCIVSHSPGTGKSRLTIVFLQTFLKLYPECRPVIIAPRGMLLTWEHEFQKWKVDIKFHNLNENKLSSQETAIAVSVIDQARVDKKCTDFIRFMKLYSWMKGGGILGISYQLFEKLAGNHREHNKFRKMLLELPGLLVLDEGHTPRNDQSLMWKALTKVVTQRRIILSGTPFQNNFKELYNTLCLVNPRFIRLIMSMHSNSEVVKRRGRKRKSNAGRDEWAYLTGAISNHTAGDDGLKKLKSMIEPFVHIHRGGILQKALPGLRDCLVILKPTDLQKKLLQNTEGIANFLEQGFLSSLISVHPSLVADKPEFSDHKRKLKSLKSDPNAGVKTQFVINLIELSSRLHEKVLVFSEFIEPLRHIEKLLKSQFSWNKGREVIYIAGNLPMNHRQHMINSFNNKNSESKVLLASLKACSEGISLVGASRVVLLDVVWNPSVERQAICRAYRLGQERVVYVYHLITSVEVRKYARQAEKERISELIFCPGGVGNETRNGKVVVSEDKVLEAMVGQRGLSGIFEKIVDQPKESHLINTFGFHDLKQ